MHTLPPNAQAAIRDALEGTYKYAAQAIPDDPTAWHRVAQDDTDTASIPVPRDI